MNRIIVFFSGLLLAIQTFGNDVNYAVSAISKDLLKGANVVKRMEEVRFEIINTGQTILHQKYALTILNEAGSKHAQLVQGYDKLIQILSIEGALYDANGRELKKLKNKEIQDLSGVSEISLFDDNRIKAHNFYHATYPYTIEYELELKFNNTMFMPEWVPQEFENLAVEKSHFILVYPESYIVRYRSFNYKGAPLANTVKNKKTLEWQVSNMASIRKQYASPAWKELTTAIYLAPTEFEVEGYKGSMNNWIELGKFHLALNKGKDKLPETILQKVKELTAGIADDKEKVKLLYKFMQENTRYISIQLGIGGWQPFNAEYVAGKGYGDCKALSNYMYSILKAAGIKSNYTLVSAGDGAKNHQLMSDFPSRQFNHVILCVPLAKDSIWLECTSQSALPGYMGEFTGNRHALLIDEDGGKVVATPRYALKDNLQIRSIKGLINNEGHLDVKINTAYFGMQQDNIHGMLSYLSKDKVKKVLNEHLDLSTYEINDFKYEERKSNVPEIDEQLDIYVSNYATVSGKRLFISPNLLNRSVYRLDDEERTQDFLFDYEYRDVDSVEIEFPAGYTLEALPQDVLMKTKFGLYTSTIKINGNKLFYVRIREHYAGRFAAAEKDDISKFYETIYRADRSRIVLVKKNE